ncbi:hypothetical protein AMS68_003689 [Peltaster fructicola]|uniref:Amino-acid transporter arg-13 n=1 Tax=Peltaster fructicola TaxID=286661 RepID=A0A6H0XTS3_9PEZI|nr:hypothetical protein AMS68_003689 [Peltaster fructicola]
METKATTSYAEKSLEHAVDSTTVVAEITNHGREAIKDITFGSLAGMMGKVVEYPFDTVKVRLQSQPDHLPLAYTGPLDCFKKSLQQDGIRGLFRGLSAPMIGAAAETASLFFTYRIAQELLRSTVYKGHPTDEKLPLPVLAGAGALSGAFTSFILTPIELVKCRMQVPMQSSVDPTLGPKLGLTSNTIRPMVVISDVYRNDGIAGFWRGQLGTLLRETGGSAAWFGSYELLTATFKKRAQSNRQDATDLPIWQQMSAGAAAGVSYNFLFYPADTIKSKMQTGELGISGSNRQTFVGTAKMLWRSHGLSGLYRGCGITMARAAPSSALIFTVYEALKKAFD